MSQESESPFPERQPTRELLLAQALEACIEAERRVPGSADLIIAHQPAWARTDLRRLVALAGSLDAAATNAVMSEEFRLAARTRLMRRIGGDVKGTTQLSGWLSAVPSANGRYEVRRRRSKWFWRGGAGGLFAAVLALVATMTASADALPGDPLYGIKQAREDLGLRLARDDEARGYALLRQADARLDETSRLLEAGRTDQAAQTTQQFDEVIDRATTTFVVTVGEAPIAAPVTATVETKLGQQQQQIQSMLVTAPEPVRGQLREALAATQRSRAMVADPQVVEHALDSVGTDMPSVAAPPPSAPADAVPTPEAKIPPLQAMPSEHAVDKHEPPTTTTTAESAADSSADADPTPSAVVARGSGDAQPIRPATNSGRQSPLSNVSQHDDSAPTESMAVAHSPNRPTDDHASLAAPATTRGEELSADANPRIVATPSNQPDSRERVAEPARAPQQMTTSGPAVTSDARAESSTRVTAPPSVSQPTAATARDDATEARQPQALESRPTTAESRQTPPSNARPQATPSPGQSAGPDRHAAVAEATPKPGAENDTAPRGAFADSSSKTGATENGSKSGESGTASRTNDSSAKSGGATETPPRSGDSSSHGSPTHSGDHD